MLSTEHTNRGMTQVKETLYINHIFLKRNRGNKTAPASEQYYLKLKHHFTTYANRYIDAKAAVSVPL